MEPLRCPSTAKRNSVIKKSEIVKCEGKMDGPGKHGKYTKRGDPNTEKTEMFSLRQTLICNVFM